MGSFFSQSLFIPKPTFTEQHLPDQTGKVHIVTGGYTGIGLELCKHLYQKNAVVWIAGRSAEKADKAISELKNLSPDSKGQLQFLKVDFQDLVTIKPAAQEFLNRESKLHVLTNNAGVMMPPPNSKSAQGHDLEMATNVLGSYLLTYFLIPSLQKTAMSEPQGSVRVTWAGSMAVDAWSPKPHGITFDAEGTPVHHKDAQTNYGQSKVSNYLLAQEFARRYPISSENQVMTNAWNPGNLQSELMRHETRLMWKLFSPLVLYPTKLGGYTELFAGWSPEAGKVEHNGAFIWPWGRIASVRQDITDGISEHKTAEKLWQWCEKECKPYL